MGLELGKKVSSGLKIASTALALNLTPVVADQFATSKDALMSAAEASESMKTIFNSEEDALEYAEDNGLKLVKDFYHKYGFVSPELAQEQLIPKDNVEVYSDGMIVLYEGLEGWILTGKGDVTRITIHTRSEGGDGKKADDGNGGGCGNPAGCN